MLIYNENNEIKQIKYNITIFLFNSIYTIYHYLILTDIECIFF